MGPRTGAEIEDPSAPRVEVRLGDSRSEALLQTLMEEFYRGERLPYHRDVVASCLRQLWDDPGLGKIGLIHVGGELVGYVVVTFGFSLEFRGRDALVDEFYVRPDHRGRGYGTACLRWVEELCRTEGIQAVHLEVDHDNFRAQELYGRAGYADHGRYLLTKWLA